MTSVIELRDLSFAYRDRAVLKSICLSVGTGEMVGILGPNGSGKTTLLRVLSAILVGTGKAELNGRDIKEYGRRELSRLFAVVPQENRVSFPYRVTEIVLMGRASYHGAFALEGKKDLEVARESMELTDCLTLSNRYFHELSGGEKQRVMIARALAQEPRIFLLDEPAAFLDLRHQVDVFALLRRLSRDRGLTVVAALHDINLAAVFFPRLVVLREGEIYRDGSPREVLTEKTIDEVYGLRVRVETDAFGDRPQLFLCPPSDVVANDSLYDTRARPGQ